VLCLWCWTFDDADLSGNNPLDIFGDNNGTNEGGVTTGVAGQVGEAFSFDGVDDYVNCGNDESLDITDAITISLWFKLNNQPTSGYPTFICKPDSDDWSPPYAEYVFRIFTDSPNCGKLEFFMPEYETTRTYSTTMPQQGQWYHTAVTYDGSDVKIYVNGTLETTNTVASSWGSSSIRLSIGARAPPSAISEFFNDLIDEVAIFNRALSPEEISDLYDLGVAGKGYCEAVPGNLTLSWVSPSASTYVAQNEFWNFTLNLSCSSDGDCGFVNVTLDPWMINELMAGNDLQLDEDGNVIGRPSNTEITKETNKKPAEKNWLEKIVEFVKEIFRKG